MQRININTTQKIIPMLYGYTTPQIRSHDGWTKIGYTEKQTVEDRIKQQTHTSDVEWNLEWKKAAVYDDGSGDTFTDHEFHAYLQKNAVERKPDTEWFHISGTESKNMLIDFKETRGVLYAKGTTVPYKLRDEQDRAVSAAKAYFDSHDKAEFLWNAKPRFGKTLAAYDLCRRMKASSGEKAFNVLIVTNRPAIANSWYEDFVKFLGDESGFAFVSETDNLKGKPYVLSRKQYIDSLSGKNSRSAVEFVSLQDLKGSLYFGGQYDKLSEVKEMNWDLLIVDEAHEGVDTAKTDIAFYQIKRRYTLHLSGTPFKALASDKFEENAVFNWTYADEQKKKREWDETQGTNPYEPLPRLNLFTYQMSEIIRSELKQGVEIDGETEEYAFDLNLFFETNANGKFRYDSSVNKFLDALTVLEKYPFSTPELRNELKHTLWLLNRVASAKALAKKLREHPVFKDYEIVLAAGDGKLSEDDEAKNSYTKVRNAIETHDKTITISVGQLTTGITVPEWTAVIMLSNIKSPALYMQAAFRAQNPWKYQKGGEYFVKENAYVFDFDPARTLIIFEEFANDLSSGTSGGKGDSDSRKQNVRELLNFFPVIGEDESGEMIELDAEKVLSIPGKIRSVEVVRRGFISNFLFQNIGNIFSAPQEVIDIIQNFEPVSEGNAVNVSKEERAKVSVDDEGEVEVDEAFVIGQTQGIFGDKIYSEITSVIEAKTADIVENTPEKKMIDQLQETLKTELITPVMEITAKKYGSDIKPKDGKSIQKHLEQKTEKIVTQAVSDFTIKKREIEQQRNEALSNLIERGQTEKEVNDEFDALITDATTNFKKRISEKLEETLPELTTEVVRTVETKKQERQKESIEDAVRNHLRGFTRTIPSFLMAYGDENTTLANFDSIIPDDVFKEVTSITIKEFRFLRDGGNYRDSETGEEKHYQGNLFDEVVFNDSVKEFLSLKNRLADYFDESNEEDIFDYIPPQKTNQIFTPKNVVKMMVDMLEQENPGCFDDPDKTFADLYMKSGLYIAEIVKRLYNSPKMSELIPDSDKRLDHIFEKQVYGLAPTEIIYRIALSFILGFDSNSDERKHNFRMLDALPYAKEGTLENKLDELFG